MAPGQIEAFIVQGDVQLVANNGKASPLNKGQIFAEGNLIKAGPNGMALLVFSNGAIIKVLENCQLSVDQFEQAKFDEQKDGAFLRLTKDPSKSTTSLDLRNGTVQCEVKQLNAMVGSTFTIRTPAGRFDGRGPLLMESLSVVRKTAGQPVARNASDWSPDMAEIANCLAGGLTFSPIIDKNIAGATPRKDSINLLGETYLTATLFTDPVTSEITGGSLNGGPLPVATCQDLFDAFVETVNEARIANNLPAQPPPIVNTGAGSPVVFTADGTILQPAKMLMKSIPDSPAPPKDAPAIFPASP